MRQRGHIDVVGCLVGVEVLFGNQGIFIEFLATLVIELFLFQICFGVIHIRHRHLLSGNVSGDVTLCSADGGLLRSHCGFQRDILNDRQDFAVFDVVTLFDIQMGNRSKSGGSDIDIILGQRLDFARAADDAGKILARHLGSQYFLRIGIAAVDGQRNQGSTANQDHDHNGNRLLVHLHSAVSSVIVGITQKLTGIFRRVLYLYVRCSADKVPFCDSAWELQSRAEVIGTIAVPS